MSKRQRQVIGVWAILIVLIGLFPPTIKRTDFGSGPRYYGGGHHFLFARDNMGNLQLVEPGRLLAYWGSVTAVGAAVLALASRKKNAAI